VEIRPPYCGFLRHISAPSHSCTASLIKIAGYFFSQLNEDSHRCAQEGVFPPHKDGLSLQALRLQRDGQQVVMGQRNLAGNKVERFVRRTISITAPKALASICTLGRISYLRQ